jgi:hypothetical protein
VGLLRLFCYDIIIERGGKMGERKREEKMGERKRKRKKMQIPKQSRISWQ